MCDFITQSSKLPFLEQFANTVVVDSAAMGLGGLGKGVRRVLALESRAWTPGLRRSGISISREPTKFPALASLLLSVVTLSNSLNLNFSALNHKSHNRYSAQPTSFITDFFP